MGKSMNNSSNPNVIVEAKSEYTKQLCNTLNPVIYEGLLAMYTNAVNISDDAESILMFFQKELKNVPQWNATVIKSETGRMETRCDYFNELLTAVFVSNVSILSSVKFGKKAKKVNITIPTNESFVHEVYMTCAKRIYTNPYLYSLNNYDNITDNTGDVYAVIEKAIQDTIRNMLPIKSILSSYLGSAFDRDESSEDDAPNDSASEDGRGNASSDDESEDGDDKKKKKSDRSVVLSDMYNQEPGDANNTENEPSAEQDDDGPVDDSPMPDFFNREVTHDSDDTTAATKTENDVKDVAVTQRGHAGPVAPVPLKPVDGTTFFDDI